MYLIRLSLNTLKNQTYMCLLAISQSYPIKPRQIALSTLEQKLLLTRSLLVQAIIYNSENKNSQSGMTFYENKIDWMVAL